MTRRQVDKTIGVNCLVRVAARTTPGTYNPRISTQTVTNRLQEMVKDPAIKCMFYMRRFFFGLVYILHV